MTAFAILALCVSHVTFLFIGAGLGLWAYYTGSKQRNPIPEIHLPAASRLFRPSSTVETNGTDDDQPNDNANLPKSVRRA